VNTQRRINHAAAEGIDLQRNRLEEVPQEMIIGLVTAAAGGVLRVLEKFDSFSDVDE
jgi:hypothetical protein